MENTNKTTATAIDRLLDLYKLVKTDCAGILSKKDLSSIYFIIDNRIDEILKKEKEMDVFMILDVNFAFMQDISVGSVYSSLEEAFEVALKDVVSKDGKDIKIHGYSIEGYESTDDRLTNNNSLGSQYGVSYKSDYGNYPKCRMIVKRTVKGA